MKKVIGVFVLMALICTNLPAQDFQWAEVVFLAGRSVEDDDNEVSVATDEGNIYLAGKFKNQVFLLTEFIESKGGFDIFLANYDAEGNLYWVISAGGPGEDVAKAITVNSDGDIIITGTFEGTADFGGQTLTATRLNNIFVAVYDNLGKLKWAERAGGI